MTLDDLFGKQKVLIGMVHLLPLPGSPGYGGQFEEIEVRAQQDAQVLQKAGFDALLIENFGDVPYYPDDVPAETIAAMTTICAHLREASPLPVGVNVLRNDARAAMAIAAAIDGKFIRVNVHTGAMLTDQGILSGRAHETVRLRKSLAADVAIFADVAVKHGHPMAQVDLEEMAADCVERGLADALIVTGGRTGEEVVMDDLVRLKERFPDVPLVAGSGVTAENVREILSIADGVIVGTSIKMGAKSNNPVDVDRASQLVHCARSQ
jgi:membrane complex biogenesis BtpA family protein